MPHPLIGAAVQLRDMETLGDWLRDGNRPIEMQDFIAPARITGDVSDIVAQYKKRLDGHTGPRGIHGPFLGLDLSNPDRAIRAIVQERLIRAVEIASELDADMMVIHSPFNFWHKLNYINYAKSRGNLMDACADCLTPVLARAADAGVTLVLENIEDTDPADRRDLMAALNHPNLALSVDTGHADLAHSNYGAPPVIDVLHHAGPALAHVHLQDVDGHADRHWHPGEGRINWQPVMDYLADMDQPARLILEVNSHMHRIPDTAEMLTDMLD